MAWVKQHKLLHLRDPIVLQTEEGSGNLNKAQRHSSHFPLAKDYDTFIGYLRSLVDAE